MRTTTATALVMLALGAGAGGCALQHPRTIHVEHALPAVVEPDLAAGVLMPVHDTAADAMLVGESSEGDAFGVRPTDRFETDAARATIVGAVLHEAAVSASLPLASHPAGGTPASVNDLAAGQFVLDVTLRSLGVKNRIAGVGFVTFPRGGTAQAALDWQLFEPGGAQPIARGTAQGDGVASDPGNALLTAVRAAADSLFESAPLRNAVSQLQTKAEADLDARIASLHAAGDASGELLALASAYRVTADRARAESLFARVAALVQQLPKRPPISEDARRLAVQAQEAAEGKSYERAATLYLAAERLAPWWPEGFYNAAILLGDQGRNVAAIDAMQHYVQLMAGTPEARRAQDLIYRWQSAPANPR